MQIQFSDITAEQLEKAFTDVSEAIQTFDYIKPLADLVCGSKAAMNGVAQLMVAHPEWAIVSSSSTLNLIASFQSMLTVGIATGIYLAQRKS